MRAWAVGAGSVVGRAHARAGRNNQDAWAFAKTPDRLALVVADGCSGGAASEVGARLGVRLCCDALRRAGDPREPGFWEGVAADVLAGLRVLAAWGDARFVEDHLLFTLVAAVVTPEAAVVAHAGDGVFALDGAVRELGPYADNAPPYLGHALGGAARGFAIAAVAAGVSSLAVATDGAAALDLAALAAEPRHAAHPDALRRRLTVLAREPGRLLDDTTVIVARRERAT